MSEAWPELPLEQWADTQTTLHRWTPMLGTTRLALAPMQNHWWQITLYLTSRGLTTSAMPFAGGSVEVAFDFVDHQLVASTSDGAQRSLPLTPRSVSEFYADYMALLRELGVDVRLYPVPMEMSDTLRFTDDTTHRAYDSEAAHRCWQAMAQADRGLKDFRGGFVGKSSPSHFFWGAFDLACTRFSGRAAPLHPGGVPNCPDYVTREGYSHECISAGWWPGTTSGPVAEPAFYAYAYPEPPGCDVAPIRPEGAYYNTQLHEWILPYEYVRTATDPEQAMRDFFQSTYDAAADRGKWDRAALERPAGWQPPPSAARRS